MAAARDIRQRLQRLAWLLDSSIPIPGLKFRVGLDAILGLIPGVGDAVGVLLSSYIVREAWRLGVPRSVLIRMALNVAIEGIVGAVPILGDLFDAAWKANVRNVALLEAHASDPRRTQRASLGLLVVLIALMVLFIAGAIAGTVWLISVVIALLTSQSA